MGDDIGSTIWVFTAGEIPESSTGHEPESTSRDVLCLLNASRLDAELSITVYYTDQDPVGPYRATVAAERLCQLRINDLIDPEAVPLGIPYGVVVDSSAPIVAQFARFDSTGGGRSWAITSGVSSTPIAKVTP